MKLINTRRAIALTTIIALLTVGVASADTVTNNLTSSANVLTVAQAGTGSVTYTVNNVNTNGGDTNNGCNLAGDASLLVTAGVPTGVSASPVTVDECGVAKSMSFSVASDVTPGDYSITHTLTAQSAPGLFSNLANFTLRVTATDSTPPVITPTVSGTSGNNGWYMSDVTVTWSVTDAQSAVSSSTGCGSTTINIDTAGTTLTCSATSAGGSSSQSVTIKRDATAPTISGATSPGPNDAGWNNTDVDVAFTCDDNLSGVVSCGPDGAVSAEGAGQSVSGTAVDAAGNSASTLVGDISIDKTAPTISGAATPSANAAGWNNTDVTVSFTCSDDLSGVAGCPDDVELTTEGTGLGASGTATDLAGNSDTASVSGIKIDKTPPTSVVTGVTQGAVYAGAPSVTCTATDTRSGVATHGSPSGNTTTAGVKTVTCNGATDAAGNTQATASPEVSYTLAPIGGFNSNFDGNAVLKVKPNQAIPLKWSFTNGSSNVALLESATIVSHVSNCTLNAELVGTETPEVAAGASGLQLLPDGSYQMNWKATTTTGCRAVTVKMVFVGGSEHTRTIYVDIKK